MIRIAALGALLAACTHGEPVRALPVLARAPTAAYLAGMLAGYRGDVDAAVDALQAAAVAAPEDPMIAVAVARAQVKATHAAAARTTIAAAHARWPRHPEVQLAYAEILAANGDRPAALLAYLAATKLAPDDERGYLGVARMDALLAFAPREREILAQLVARIPSSIDGHYALAKVLAAHRDYPAAIAQLRATIELDPDQIDARMDLSRALRISGHLADAIAPMRSAFDRSGQALDIAEELFWLLCEADDRTGAIDLLATLDDDNLPADGLALLARLYRTLGLPDDARRLATRLGTLDATAGQLALAELELGTGEASAAAGRARAIRQPPATPAQLADARRIAATAALALQDPAGAIDAAQAGRAAAPADVELALVLATATADAGKPAEARALLAGLATGSRDAYFAVQMARARLEEHLGARAAARAIVAQLLAVSPDAPNALNYLGYLYADDKLQLGDAERLLRRARELEPGSPAILDSWGWLRLRKGDVPGALAAMTHAVHITPNDPELVAHLAAATAAAHRPADAAQLFDRALALRPSAEVRARIETLRATGP